MRTLLPEIETWLAAGKRVAVATIVRVWGSAPRPVGSRMAISDAGDMAGSVSGGCVEGAVYEEAQGVLSRGRPRLVRYGVSDEDAWAVGLSCGGEIEIFIDRGPINEGLRRALEDEELVVEARVIGPEDAPDLGRRGLVHGDGALAGNLPEALREAVLDAAATLLTTHATARLSHAGLDVFLEAHAPRRKLVIVGAVHAAIPLVRFARELGFRTFVVDPRTAFATPERFADADELVTDWPDEALRRIGLDVSSYVALLSHDLKLDLPALEVALASPARYIGALGSRKTHGKRLAALREAGWDDDAVSRIHNPIGLPLGGRRAEEVAVSILAEIVAVGHGVRLVSASS